MSCRTSDRIAHMLQSHLRKPVNSSPSKLDHKQTPSSSYSIGFVYRPSGHSCLRRSQYPSHSSHRICQLSTAALPASCFEPLKSATRQRAYIFSDRHDSYQQTLCLHIAGIASRYMPMSWSSTRSAFLLPRGRGKALVLRSLRVAYEAPAK